MYNIHYSLMLYTTAIMISITTVLMYIHICINRQIQADSVVSGTNGLLIPGFGPWWHKERDTILTMVTALQRVVHLVMSKIFVGRDPKNPTTSFNGQNPTLASMVQSQLILFKILKFSGPSPPGMTSSPLQPISCLGGLLWQIVTHILCARA